MPSSNSNIDPNTFKNISKLNDLITQSTKILTSCQEGDPCYIEELRQTYEKSKYDLLNDPGRVHTNREKYIIAKNGETYYNDLIKKESYQKAESSVIELLDNYIKNLIIVYNQNKTLNVIEKNNNLIDKNYILQNKLNQQLYNNNSSTNQVFSQTPNNSSVNLISDDDTNINSNIYDSPEFYLNNQNTTNERMIYYEQVNYIHLKSWYQFWFYIYLILLILFSLSLLFTNNRISYYSFISKIGIIILLTIFLFIIKYLSMFIISFINFCINIYPKNVYLSFASQYPTQNTYIKTVLTDTPQTQIIIGNNGTVSCDKYCSGSQGGPTNNELPPSWNGAKCVGVVGPAEQQQAGCYKNFSIPDNQPTSSCICMQTGTGWNKN